MLARQLPNVPEEGAFSPSPTPHHSHSSSSLSSISTAKPPRSGSHSSSSSGGSSGNRKTPSLRSLGSLDQTGGPRASGSSTNARSSSPSITTATNSATANTANTTNTPKKIRTTPRLPHDHNIPATPSTLSYWSRAPVHGTLPTRAMRAHSTTLVDSTIWLFGGCDDRDCWKDVYSFDIDTMQWAHPETTGDEPPPCRAHTSTLVDRKLVMIGGGQASTYYNDVYVLDTITRRWSRPSFPSSPSDPIPPPRRAHTAVLFQGKIWVFGGGNGMTALNDVWTLDVSGLSSSATSSNSNSATGKMRWTEIQTKGKKPGSRGYHTATLVGNVMVVIGGSDGKECFDDIWCLNLATVTWTRVPPSPPQTSLDAPHTQTHKRLSHSATQVGSYLFIMGGHDGVVYHNDVLAFNLVSLQYEPRPLAGIPPSPRGYHAALLADARLFIFGGFDGLQVFDDVHILDLAAAAYLPQVTSFEIGLVEGW